MNKCVHVLFNPKLTQKAVKIHKFKTIKTSNYVPEYFLNIIYDAVHTSM
jgi:hypothetical protein